MSGNPKTPSTGPDTGGVGAALPHDSAAKHVSGAAVYIDDMPDLPGTLHAAIVKSARPHARIVGIDPAAALAMPGVVGFVSAADIPGANDIAPILSGEPCLADGVAEYHGQPLGAVAAETFEAARDAAKAVAVAYQDLPPVLSIEEALAAKSFVSAPQEMKAGDAAGALARAKNRLKGRVTCGGQDHFYLEGQIALAVPQEDRDMLVFSSTQHPSESSTAWRICLASIPVTSPWRCGAWAAASAARKAIPRSSPGSPHCWPTGCGGRSNCVFRATTT